jgi:hypothetical protein
VKLSRGVPSLALKQTAGIGSRLAQYAELSLTGKQPSKCWTFQATTSKIQSYVRPLTARGQGRISVVTGSIRFIVRRTQMPQKWNKNDQEHAKVCTLFAIEPSKSLIPNLDIWSPKCIMQGTTEFGMEGV